MSEGPWFKFYPSDWLAGTRGMTATEMGVYITIIAMIYDAGGPVRDDEKRLARRCGISVATFRKIRDALIDEGKIEVAESGISNARAISEIENREKISQSNRDSANERWKVEKGKKAEKTVPDECDRIENAMPRARASEARDSSLRSESAALLSGAHAPAPAREAITPNRLAEVLHAAAGAAMARTPGAELMTIPLRWLADGMDLEADVLPVIRAKCGRAPPGSINGWAYFTRAVHEAHQTRTAPMEIQPDVKPARRSPPRTHAERADDCLRETVAALAEAFGGRSQTPGSTPFAGFDAGGEIVDLEPDPGIDADDHAIGGRW